MQLSMPEETERGVPLPSRIACTVRTVHNTRIQYSKLILPSVDTVRTYCTCRSPAIDLHYDGHNGSCRVVSAAIVNP
jgi:hypothetical protein